ncbi:MAG: hypothetical protein KF715_07035 [Candidatus Didemnitutus sp.]|nr:hypothetical protein [Candidatus Didemnitutus sp.]
MASFAIVHRVFASPLRSIFIGTLLVLVVVNHAFLFRTAWHEDGDFAVNALQIERAKHLNEIYGNYSRFQFNHPGPAFFYVYAAGEYILYDWLQVVPSPHNAHAIAGTILQTFFFALALTLAARWVRSPWLVPLALALAGVHYGLAGDAFTSIWPPHALLMPMLCLLVAAASVAAGRVEDLPILVLTGCLLVHGHVAQPLIVGLVFAASYALMWRQRKQAGDLRKPWQVAPWPHGIAAAGIVAFAVPLVIDLSYGSRSNLATILRFLLAEKPHRTFVESIVYFLSFLGYEHRQEHYLTGRSIDFSFMRSAALAYAIWALVLGFTTWRMRQIARKKVRTEGERFAVALGQVAAVAVFAVVLWGRAQNGDMFAFNGYFYFSILYALALLAAILLAELLPARGALLGGALLCASGVLAYSQLAAPPPSTNNASTAWRDATAAALEADPQPNAPKFLVFNHDDWGDVARTALALKRMGGSYRVDESWGFMFGPYRTLPTTDIGTLGRYSIWRFSHHDLTGPSVKLGRGLRVFFEPGSINPTGDLISCRATGNFDQFSLFGFASPDEGFTWTNLPRAAFQFRSAQPANGDVEIAIEARPYQSPKRAVQPMRLSVNGEPVGEFQLEKQETVRAVVPARVWNREPIVTIVFEFPAAESPREMGTSDDPRILGWGIYSLKFREVW